MMQQENDDSNFGSKDSTIYQSIHYENSNDIRTPQQQSSSIWKTIRQGSNNLSSLVLSSTSTTSNQRLNFLPDFTEHPKPLIIRHKTAPSRPPTEDTIPPEDEENEITFFHDFIAGGVAGSASVIVGHPFDTVKVRMQTSKSATSGVLAALSSEYGGLTSLFRGISAPLYTAALVNAIVFGSYGFSSRVYSDYYSEQQATYDDDDNVNIPTHDPWQKAMTCGSFAGLMQCFVICPMEHVKCRLQTQQAGTKGSANHYKGPFAATGSIIRNHGIYRLYQGWWTTCLREVPAFGLYFVSYDYLKDMANEYIANNMDVVPTAPHSTTNNDHSHTWMASAFAGGCAGCITWALVYPVDVIKTHIQTAPLTTPLRELSMFRVGYSIFQKYGIRYLFRGLGVTLIRAFPVNGTIFPVYEFTLKLVCQYIDKRQ